MEVGTEDDSSPIKTMCVLGGSMHVIKAQGIYRVQLADEIDPQRTNPAIPHTYQRVLRYGTDCELVRQTLMTAKRLFDTKLLGAAFSYTQATDHSFEALKDLIAMHEMRLGLEVSLNKISEALGGLIIKNRALPVPTVGEPRVLVETFIQKADHVIADLFAIAKLFYPEEIGKKWFESLFELAKERCGSDQPFTKFLAEALPFLKLIRNARNCVEHPKVDRRLEVFDITLLPSGQLRPPTMEIIEQDTPQPIIAIVDFMAQTIVQLASTFELMIAYLCGTNIQPFAGFPVQVVQYPPNLQKAYGVKLGYGIYDGNRIIPFG